MIWHGVRHVRSEQDSFGEGCLCDGRGGCGAPVRWLSPERMVTAFLKSFCIVFLYFNVGWTQFHTFPHNKAVFHISSRGVL